MHYIYFADYSYIVEIINHQVMACTCYTARDDHVSVLP